MSKRHLTRIVMPAVAGLLLVASAAVAETQTVASVIEADFTQSVATPVRAAIDTPVARAATRAFPEMIGAGIVGLLCTYRFWSRGRII